MPSIDINCDLGEGFPNDDELMGFISSANIACGFHAGNFSLMSKLVSMAIQNDVAIGAHPGFPDALNFGRLEMTFSNQAIYDMMLYQIGALHAIVKAQRARLHHVKPHGALYNMAAVSKEMSEAIVKAIYDFDPELVLYGLANSELINVAKAMGLPFKQEVFADRTYQANGTLTPRSQPDAMIVNSDLAITHVLQMVKEKTVIATSRERVPIQADTVCIHGDGAHALEFAKALNARIKVERIQIIASG